MLPQGIAIYRTDLFLPDYRKLQQGDWHIGVAPMGLMRGYWSPPQLSTNVVVLMRGGETWMSTSPMEIESQEIGVRLSRGHVLIYGMGMGWSAINCALRDEVERVTVVEFDEDVLALHRELDLAAQLPASARDKLHIVQGDAYTYTPEQAVDLLMPDIWLWLMNEGRVEEVRAMQARVGAREVYFWGQELEIARQALARGRALDVAGIEATVAELGLPLLGPALPDYADTVRIVADAHLARCMANLARTDAPTAA